MTKRLYVRGSVDERFAARVLAGDVSRCWAWVGYRDKLGYGVFAVTPGKSVLAHRMAWERANAAAIPAGMLVLHACDTPSCVNPDHLSLGTDADNMRDCLSRGRHPNASATHCKRGHEFTTENTLSAIRSTTKRIYRNCRSCKTAGKLARRLLSQTQVRPDDHRESDAR